MTHDPDPTLAIAALRRAIPYLRIYKRAIFVLKAGGEAFSNPADTLALMEQVTLLFQVGVRVVLVHGGGPQTTQTAKKLGLETRLVAGRRVTDAATLEVAEMTMRGSVQSKILAACRKLGVPAVGISGIDSGLIRAKRRPPVVTDDGERVDYGFVGDIVGVNTAFLEKLLDEGLLPVVCPLSADDEGTILNVNADVVAAAIARAMGAKKLMLLTDAPGILSDREDPSTLVSYTDLPGLERMEKEGSIHGGMLPKVAAVRDALEGGVARVHVLSHRSPDALLTEVFTNEGSGTLVVKDRRDLRPEELAQETFPVAPVR